MVSPSFKQFIFQNPAHSFGVSLPFLQQPGCRQILRHRIWVLMGIWLCYVLSLVRLWAGALGSGWSSDSLLKDSGLTPTFVLPFQTFVP